MALDHATKNEALNRQAIDAYSRIAALGVSVDSIFHELHEADHNGWMRGMSDHAAIVEKYHVNYDAHYFIVGAVFGAAVATSLLKLWV